MSELPKLEIYFYFLVWIVGILASLYNLFLVGQAFSHNHHNHYNKYQYQHFKKGWKLLGDRFLDQTDYEWNAWTASTVELTPYLLINFIGAECLRNRKCTYILPVWYTIITVVFLTLHFNIFLPLWFIAQTVMFALAIHCNSHIFIWVLSSILMYLGKSNMWFTMNERQQYLIMISSSWFLLKCISFSSDKLNKLHQEKNKRAVTVTDVTFLLGYSLYLPTLFWGPFISYQYFNETFQKKSFEWTLQKALGLLKNFIKCLFWYFFTLFVLHFIYVNMILLNPYLIKNFLDWELAGLGIAMGLFFHLKYVVFYGIPCAWAFADGLTTPKLPCCVFRVNLYSYMWRYFDHGLYQFLIRYIYIPIILQIKGKHILGKMMASIFSFIFIYIWHEGPKCIIFWVLSNFIALTIEFFFKQIYTVSAVQNFLSRHFSPQNLTRLQCLLAAPLHCFSMVANYIFIANNLEVGIIYLKRILYASTTSKLTILFFLYGAGHTAVATQKWEKQKNKSKSKEA